MRMLIQSGGIGGTILSFERTHQLSPEHRCCYSDVEKHCPEVAAGNDVRMEVKTPLAAASVDV